MKSIGSLAILLFLNISVQASDFDPLVDKRRIYKSYLSAAKNGDITAIYQVGRALLSGQGVDQDKSNGLKHIRMAAANGNMNAICHLEGIYRYGVVDDKWVVEAADEEKELKYKDRCKTAIRASLDDSTIAASTQLRVAEYIERGRRGFDQDLDLAKKTYDDAIRKLESQEDVDSLILLSQIYRRGGAMRFPDEAKALEYAQRALETDHPNVWYHFGGLLEDTDPDRSMSYFRKAANADHYRAMLALILELPDDSPEILQLYLSRYEQVKAASSARGLSDFYAQNGQKAEALQWGLKSLFGGNGYKLHRNFSWLYNRFIEFSGVRDVDLADHDARKKKWDAMRSSEFYSDLYQRGSQLSDLCSMTIGHGDNEGFCSTKTYMEQLKAPVR